MTDTKSYDTAGITDSEGAVIINYYNNKTNELIKKQTLTGDIGSGYDISQLASTVKYDVKKTQGDAKGVFTDQILSADVYVEEYDGDMSTVTFKFVDDINGTEL